MVMTIPASVPRNRTGFTSPETHRGYRKNNKNARIARHVPPNPTAKARFSFAVWTSMPRPSRPLRPISVGASNGALSPCTAEEPKAPR